MQSRHTAQGDLEERVSYIQSATNDFEGGKDGQYADLKTPNDLEDGALVEGGALELWSKEAMGLFAQYAAIGVIYGLIPALNYPIFNVYLYLEGYQTASYGTLVVLGWSFKVFFGMLSDCVPILGYRRKSWMLIGWTITMICLGIMSFWPFGEPYCNRELAEARNTTACSKPYSKASAADKELFNPSAPDNGTVFIMLSMLVSFGYVLADCAADAMVVEYAQREPTAIRGRVQTAIYTVRTLFGIIAYVVQGFGLNGVNYGGSFSFSMGPNVPYIICFIPCIIVVLSTIFVLEEKKAPGIPFKQYIANFWELLQQRVMWQICAFKFISQVFQGISSTAGSPMYQTWANVEPLNDALSSILGNAIFSAILIIVGKWGLHWNWRWTIALSSISVLLIDMPINFITIWDVLRNQWFYNGVALAENVPGGVKFIVSTYCAVEIADKGNEGATYGLVTTISNLASPFASVIYKIVDSYFKVSQDDIQDDTNEVRWDVTYTYLFAYGCKFFALVWLFMLPPQKKEMQELKKKGGKSKAAGITLIVLFVCYRIVGGKGTDPKTGKCPLPKSKKGF
ncbi:Aste57867_17281 [Aphanomyces stellatus]|uniref:Aste57867_17281 protein n=1 Tax=Aphanomyces stellatus TaxID=120398 RepID=A0A485L935_9STRA|nr:hypothetical protein As57867_017222 [Aphanomyces stellatus]VFT94037.1 Aste57867_17281 [Aphanomyces stellatus]